MPGLTLELTPHELFFSAPGTPAPAPAERIAIKVNGQLRDFWRGHLSDDEIKALLSP